MLSMFINICSFSPAGPACFLDVPWVSMGSGWLCAAMMHTTPWEREGEMRERKKERGSAWWIKRDGRNEEIKNTCHREIKERSYGRTARQKESALINKLCSVCNSKSKSILIKRHWHQVLFTSAQRASPLHTVEDADAVVNSYTCNVWVAHCFNGLSPMQAVSFTFNEPAL